MKTTLLLLLCCVFGMYGQNFWTEVAPFPSNPQFEPRQIAIAGSDVVWVCGYDSTSYSFKWSRSLDGGVTWIEGDITLPAAELAVGAICAVSETTAYVSVFPTSPASQGGIWVTQDSGTTWMQQTSAFGTNSFPNFIHFWDSTSGIAVGDPQNGSFEIYNTTDSGMNWIPVAAANIPAPLADEYGYTEIYETRDNTIWFGTSKGRLYRSTDQGMNWTVIQTPLSDFSSSNESGRFAFRNADEGMLIDSNWRMYKTDDGGATWTLQIPEGSVRNFNVVYVPETNNAYFNWGENQSTGYRGSSYSINGGWDWVDLDSSDAQPVEPIEVAFQSGTVGYCIGRYLFGSSSDTRFFRLTDPLNRLLKNNEFEVGDTFSVHPNPTNGFVNITGTNIDSVKMYDITGKELFSSKYNSLDQIEIDISSFKDGIYLGKINPEHDVSSTFKIIKN